MGSFLIQWSPGDNDLNRGSLKIRHQDEPERTLWFTHPGRSFIGASQTVTTLQEHHGSFQLESRPILRCDDQILESIEREEDSPRIVLRGSFREAPHLNYTLTFTSTHKHELQFQLEMNSARNRLPIDRLYLRLALPEKDPIFGLGTQFSHLDLRGRRFLVMTQEQGIGRGLQPLTTAVNLLASSGGSHDSTYAPSPFVLTGGRRSLTLDNLQPSRFDFRRPGDLVVELLDKPRSNPTLSGRILYARTHLKILQRHTRHVGRMPPLPEWVGRGVILGLQGGSPKVRATLARLRRLKVPVAAVWLQDWVGSRETAFGSQLWWNWEVDRKRYPDWNRLISELRQQNIRVLGYVNPFLTPVDEKPEVKRNLYQEALERGFLVRRSDGTPYLSPITTFDAALVDLTNPEASAWLKSVIRVQLLETGVSGWMADFGESLAFDSSLHQNADPWIEHNRYPERWASLQRELLEDENLIGSCLIFHRSGFSRSPEHAISFWLGDQMVTWDRQDGLHSALLGLLSSGLSGFTLNHSDIGGYTAVSLPGFRYQRSQELLLRWMEFAAFTPIFRTHEGNQPETNIQFDHNALTLKHLGRFARLYACLSPYRKSLMKEASTLGHPLVRPLWLHDSEDPLTFELDRQFLLGPDLLVAPTLEPGSSQTRVYLPKHASWRHLWTGDLVESGWRQVPTPLGKPAVFLREHGLHTQNLWKMFRDAGLIER
ncbi:MAG: alpha-glucosidase [Planctomycetota bacterium]|nr:alpha-glucosidase [Planctomycetota bacterium]